MENAGKFYGHLKYFTGIWYILWPFGNVVAIWYIFPRFGILCQEKSGNPETDLYVRALISPSNICLTFCIDSRLPLRKHSRRRVFT
jgi:hypothetical protein